MSATKRPDAPLSIRLSDLAPHVDRRGDNQRAVVKRDLTRYYNLLTYGVPKLTLPEARAVYGHFTSPGVGTMELYEHIGGPDARIRYMRLLCMQDALERAQRLVAAGDTTLDAALVDVGLVKRGS